MKTCPFLLQPSRIFARLSSSAKLLLPALLLCAGTGFAASLTWDGGDQTANSSYGGSGTWDTSTSTNWTGASGEAQWTDTTGVDTAVFLGTPGTVTLSGTNTANRLSFGISGFTLTGGGLNLAGTSPSIDTGSGAVTINSGVSDTSSAGLTKVGSGVLTLGGVNTYTGATAINAGTVRVNAGTGSLATTALSFGGIGGMLGYDNTTSSGARAQSLGTLTFGGGDGVVQSARTAAQNVALTFSSLGTRSAGATGNFVVTGGSNGASNKIAITGQSTGLMGQGLFFNGGSYAYYDSGGFVRALSYGADANSVLVKAPATTLGAGITGEDVQLFSFGVRATATGASGGTITVSTASAALMQVGDILVASADGQLYGANPIPVNTTITAINTSTGVLTLSQGIINGGGGNQFNTNQGFSAYRGITAQTTDSVNTLNLKGDGAQLIMGTGQTLTISGGGILRSGNNLVGAMMVGGTIRSGANTELVVRTDAFNDTLTINSVIGANGTSGLTKSGAGVLSLGGSNTFTGGVTMNAGRLNINNASALGTTSGSLTINGGLIDVGSAIATPNYTQVWGGDFMFVGSNTLNLGTGSVSLGANAGATRTVNVNGSTLTVGGIISNGTNPAVPTVNLTKTGGGTLSLSGSNAYTGTTAVSQGTLNLNFAGTGAPLTNIVNTSLPLVLGGIGGGTLSVSGKASASTSNSQAFNGVNLAAGASAFSIADGNATNFTKVDLGSLIRSVGSTVNFTQPTTNTTVSGSNGYITASANDSTGILGGWATVGGTEWASNNGTNIVAYSLNGSYAGYTGDSWDPTFNTTVTTNSPISSATTNTLRFAFPGVQTLTLSGINTIATGGILVTSAVGLNGPTITGGTLQGSSGGDLIFNTLSTGTTTAQAAIIASTIADNGSPTALTKSGSGVLALTGSNTFTGGIFVNAGTLVLNAAGAYGGTGDVNVVGGTLTVSSTNALSGSGNLVVKSGAANLNIATNYTGSTSILAGTVNVGAASLSGSNGAFGNSTSPILLGDTSGGLASTIKFTSGVTLGRSIILQGGNTGIMAISVSNAVGVTPTISGTITLGSNGIGHDLLLELSNFNAGNNLNISGIIQDPVGLTGLPGTVSVVGYTSGGTSKLTLSGSNTLSGGFILDPGYSSGGSTASTQLAINNPSALGTGVFTINGGTISTAGTVTSISGQIWNASFGVISGTSANLGTSPVTLANPSRLTGLGSDQANLTVGGIISGSGQALSIAQGFTNATNNSVTLGGASTFDGGFTINSRNTTTSAVILNIGNLGTSSAGSAIGTGTLTIGNGLIPFSSTALRFDNTSGAAGTLATNNPQVWNNDFQFIGTKSLNMGTGAVTLSNTTAALTVTTSGSSLTIGGVISNGSVGNALTKAGAGILALAGANTYTGDTTVSSGTLNLANTLALQNSTLASGTIVFDSSVSSHAFTFGGVKGGTNIALQDNAGSPNAVALTVGNNNQSTAYTGRFSGAGSLTKVGSGTLTLSGTNTYTGVTNVNNGTLTVNNSTGSGTGTGQVTVASGATLNGTGSISGNVIVSGSLSGSLTLNGNATINGGATAAATAFNGNITANGSITSSVSVLSGMAISGSGSVAGVTVNSGGTLNANTSNLTTGALSIASSGTFALSLNTTAATTGKVAATDLTLGASTVLSITDLGSGASSTFAFLDYTGTLLGQFTYSGIINGSSTTAVLAGGETLTVNGNDYTFQYAYSDAGINSVALLAVPEPCTVAMLLGGFGFLLMGQKLRRRSAR